MKLSLGHTQKQEKKMFAELLFTPETSVILNRIVKTVKMWPYM